jgi:quercetin dioxygenase-like cupin family protein
VTEPSTGTDATTGRSMAQSYARHGARTTKSDRTTFFDGDQIPFFDPTEGSTTDLNAVSDVPESVRGKVDLNEYLGNGTIQIQILLNQTDANGYSLQGVKYPPNAYIPRHRHDVDQVVLVLEGELRQGNRIVNAGSGYFTPAGDAYAVKAGPEGVHLVEFRHAGLNFSTEWVEDDPDRWAHGE